MFDYATTNGRTSGRRRRLGSDAAVPQRPSGVGSERWPGPPLPVRARLASGTVAVRAAAAGGIVAFDTGVSPGQASHASSVPGAYALVDDLRPLPRPFLDIRPRSRSGGLVGLLSLAFHPRYATDKRAYVMYTAPGGNLVVLELRVRGGRARPHRVIFSVPVPSSLYAHVGGQLAFGPGGRLHEASATGLDPAAAQDPEQALGKILRLDVDPPFAPPEDRGDRPAQPVAVLLRPWHGRSLHRDVGERAFEEINVIRRGTRGVPNFGWGAEPPAPDAVPAFVQYAHPARDCAAVIGGFVYRGRELPAARGRYFYGDTCSGTVWSVRAAAASPRPRKEPFTVGQLASFGEDVAGELYLVARGLGGVVRLTRK